MWVLTRGKIGWPGTIDWSYIDNICRYIYSFHFSLPMGYSPLLGKSYREGKRHSQQTDTSTDHNKGSSGVLYKANEEGKLQACWKASCKRSFELSLNYWKIRKGKGISGKSDNVYDSTKAWKNETIEWWLLWDEYIVDGLRGTGRQEEGQEERQESRWNLCLRSGCVWSLTTSPRSLELLSRVMSSVECARTRVDMLCILEICSGLGYLVSYFNLTAPVAFIYNKLLRGHCWFSLFLHCPFRPILLLVFTTPVKLFVLGLPNVILMDAPLFVFILFLTVIHMAVIPPSWYTLSLSTLTTDSSPPTSKTFAFPISLHASLLSDF